MDFNIHLVRWISKPMSIHTYATCSLLLKIVLNKVEGIEDYDKPFETN